jgi:autotransporter-associated beta strand protein
MVSQGKELVALASARDPAALGNSSAPGLLASPVLSPGALEAVAHLRALPFKKRHGWAEPSRPRGDDGENEQAEPSNVVVDDDDDGDSATAAELALLQHDAIPERLQHDEHTPRFKWRSVCELSPLQQPDASARPGAFKWKTIDVQQGPNVVRFNGSIVWDGITAYTPFLTLQGAGSGLIAGSISDGGQTTALPVTKKGTGTWTLSGTSTISGVVRLGSS